MTMTARRAVLLAGAAFLTPLTALGQESDSLTLDTIVLRAGQPRVASGVPQAVTVIDEDELTAIEPATIGDVLDVVPGVSGVGSSSFFGQSFNIRGIGEGIAAFSPLFAAVAADPTVFDAALARWGLSPDPLTAELVLTARTGPDRL